MWRHNYSMNDADKKPVNWIGSSYDDLLKFPVEVVRAVGYALGEAQNGRVARHAKPLKGFGGASVVVVEDFQTNTYRAVYTARFTNAVYVLHCFQKKSKSGIETPRQEIELIRRRLQVARALEAQALEEGMP